MAVTGSPGPGTWLQRYRKPGMDACLSRSYSQTGMMRVMMVMVMMVVRRMMMMMIMITKS